MALTRKMLKAMGIDEEKIETIIDAHVESVNALKQERDTYKDDADKLEGVQKELDDVQKELDDLKKNGGDWQKKYEKEHTDFEAYKADQTTKETKASKDKAYRALLKDAGVSEKRFDVILKVTNLDEIELDTDGKIKDADTLKKNIQTDYADFVETTYERGAYVATPPKRDKGSAMTREEIYKMENGRFVLSASERQAELAKLYEKEKGN